MYYIFPHDGNTDGDTNYDAAFAVGDTYPNTMELVKQELTQFLKSQDDGEDEEYDDYVAKVVDGCVGAFVLDHRAAFAIEAIRSIDTGCDEESYAYQRAIKVIARSMSLVVIGEKMEG